VFVLAYLAGLGLDLAVRWRFATDTALPDIAGAVLFAAGALLAGWAWSIFNRARTTRVPGELSTTLVVRGPYRFTRNPMYVGLAAAYLGEAGMLKQVWPIILLPLVLAYLNRIVIPIEEDRLRQVFGTSYEEYRSRVGRWF
jgi:protein-S-isoprenylcysteine O-methyltransferase Ste14